MNRPIRILVATAFAGALSVLVPNLSRADTIPHVLRFATAEDVQGLNPLLNSQAVLGYMSQMTMAWLFRADHDNKLIPELALEVPSLQNHGISADGKSVTLHLRHGVKWSDGAPFDADDVVFTVNAMNNPANNVSTRFGFDKIVKMDEPDKYTVVVHLNAPFHDIVSTLFASVGLIPMVPKHLLGTLPTINQAPYNDLPVGIGPFRYKAWKRGDSVELEANPYYWRGRPKLNEVIYKIIPDRNTVLAQLQTGEIDLWYPFGGAFLARVAAIPNVSVLRMPAYAFNEINMNLKNPALADVSVRRALLYATDRKTLIAKLGHGVGILQDISAPTVDPAVPKNIPVTPYDPAKANEVLDKAGWVRGSDGIRAKNGARLFFTIASSQGSPDVDSALELIRSFWKPVGIDFDIQRYESSMLFAPKADGGILNSGKYDLAFIAWTVSLPIDPYNLYACNQTPPLGQNTGSYCNPKVDALFADMTSTYDETRYRADLEKILRTVADDVPVIVTLGRENIFGYNKALKNFHPNNSSVFDDMMNVDI